jgi:hypothetical protein
MTNLLSPNDESHTAWDTNAEIWDAKMADNGNDFVNLLLWPVRHSGYWPDLSGVTEVIKTEWMLCLQFDTSCFQ